MKYAEVKDLSVKELEKKRKVLSQDLFEAKMKNAVGQLPNPLVIRKLRKDIARINTVIVEKNSK